jgi:hypothetical protein
VLSDKSKLTKERLMNLNRFIKAVAATAGVAFASSIGIGSISSALANPIDHDPVLPTVSDCYKYMYHLLNETASIKPDGRTTYDWACAERLPNGRINKNRIDLSSCMKKKGNGIFVLRSHDYDEDREPVSWQCGKYNLP